MSIEQQIVESIGVALRNNMGAIREIAWPRLLTAKAAGEYLSMDVTEIRAMANEGGLPFVRKGKQGLRFDREDLDAWIVANRVVRK